MANTIRIKRGKSNNLSVSNLQDGELALTLDTNKLYTNKGQISPDNVYVGDTEPTDSSVKCWISPSGKISILLAAGTLGKPGIVIMLPVRATINPAPLDTLKSLTVILKPSGLASKVWSSESEY